MGVHVLKRINLASIFLSLIILLGCSKQPELSEIEKQFLLIVPVADMNKSLQIVVDSKESSFESGADISLLVYNKSSNSIYFDNSSYASLLLNLDDLQWLDVMNGITYFGTRKVSPQGTSLLDFVHTVVRPILDPTVLDVGNKNIVLRIVIVVEIMEGATRTGKNVGAYVDVISNP